ncbi:Os01g0315901 [Oryza sativa Japonica Group]|uniref:Os01g0315901 protein n=1 Tax=Oryza sativa subsp. japonica TaxID=39947 RepID=A0A0P0V1Z2_ORYSJ|nr:Os01g0315901 [Oryza sativa Japonica Group]
MEPLQQAMRPRGPRGHRRCHGGWVREARGRGLAGMAPRLMLFFLLLMEVPWHAPRERHPVMAGAVQFYCRLHRSLVAS